ncbi:MAG: SMC-Scp complex subunit ScpB, partial [Bacteroidota bacterium]
MSDQETISVAQQRVLKVPAGLKSLIEGLIFAAEEPLTVRQIKAIYEQPGGDQELHIDQQEIQTLIETLNEEYRAAKRPYRIISIAGGFQFATLKEYAEWLGRLFHEQARRKLSQSSLETLAIVSYKQPISKPEIEAIRGVNCDYVLKTLLEKELLTIVGRAETVGRPLLYGTTREFLKHFGLN